MSIPPFCSVCSSWSTSKRSCRCSYISPMTPSEIQSFRKRRLREAIDKFFGSNVALAKKLKNKDGEPLKDGSYVGHMLKAEGEPGSRPIDEDRVREIEALHPSLKGWFSLSDDVQRDTIRTNSSIQTFTGHLSSVTNTLRAPVIAWSRLGMELKLPNEQVPAEAQIPVPEEASSACKWVVVEREHPRFGIRAGYKVALEPLLDGHAFIDNELYLFKTLGGKFFLAEYRTLASGFEAIPDSGPPLESARHGIEVVAIHKGTWK